MNRKTLLIAILSGIMLVTNFVLFRNNVNLEQDKKNLIHQNDSLINKINLNPPIREDNVMLYIYQESYLKLLEEHPDCAKNYSEIMSKYE